MNKAKPITQPQFAAAIRLCQRTEGATTIELSGILRRASFDCPTTLRSYLRRYRKNLLLYSDKPKDRIKPLHGNSLRYFIQATCAMRCGYPVLHEGDICGECACEDDGI